MNLFIFVLAHLGAFVILRDMLETAGLRVIEDPNGAVDPDEAQENFAQGAGEYILSKTEISNSEAVNYVLLGKKMAVFFYNSARTGTLGDRLKGFYGAIKSQVKQQYGDQSDKYTRVPVSTLVEGVEYDIEQPLPEED